MLKKNSENMYTTEKRWMDIPTTSSEDFLACRVNFGVVGTRVAVLQGSRQVSRGINGGLVSRRSLN